MQEHLSTMPKATIRALKLKTWEQEEGRINLFFHGKTLWLGCHLGVKKGDFIRSWATCILDYLLTHTTVTKISLSPILYMFLLQPVVTNTGGSIGFGRVGIKPILLSLFVCSFFKNLFIFFVACMWISEDHFWGLVLLPAYRT